MLGVDPVEERVIHETERVSHPAFRLEQLPESAHGEIDVVQVLQYRVADDEVERSVLVERTARGLERHLMKPQIATIDQKSYAGAAPARPIDVIGRSMTSRRPRDRAQEILGETFLGLPVGIAEEWINADHSLGAEREQQ